MYRAQKLGTEEWKYGWYVQTESGDWGIICEDGEELASEFFDRKTLSQSTSKSDKTGVLLYEDDVVIDIYDARFVIVWWRDAIRMKNMESSYYYPFTPESVAKVGTIYDEAKVLYKGAPGKNERG
jgi:hypothetical protein